MIREEIRRRRLGSLGEGVVNGRTNVLTDEEFLITNPALGIDEDEENEYKLIPLSIKANVDRIEHHTDDYESRDLIVRRGQGFKVAVKFNREFNREKDQVTLQFTVGSYPKESKKTSIRVHEVEDLTAQSWGMKLNIIDEQIVEMIVMSPADAIVGEYSIYVETKTRQEESDEDLVYRTKLPHKLYILFNAWCKEDAVYMEEESRRLEYVLNDRGRIWVGNKRYFEGIPWNFGQFEEIALETSLFLLRHAELSPPAQANPVQVSRVISQMANFNDSDGGILVGRWTDSYPRHTTRPTEWTGSVEILEKYQYGEQSVKYGQCWVFSGLVTTLLRAIGIPTRCVTNSESAHDTDASMTIDFHFDEYGEPISNLNDSVWNFHVWNESFFTRPDLPDGYDGWQAIDSTPQETSDGVFRCGPCPVKAVKEGYVYLPYDTKFVFGEVNGDRVYWEVKKNGDFEVMRIDKKSIGKFISTKAVGSNDREDLTGNYKYPEGSDEEREAVHRANKFSSRKDIYEKQQAYDLIFDVDIEENVKIGNDFDIRLRIQNQSKEERNVSVTITTKAAFYTGIIATELEKMVENLKIPDEEERTLLLPILASNYLELPPDLNLKVFFNAHVQETGQVFATMETVEFVKPKLEADFPPDVVNAEPFEMELFFKNPLPMELTNGVFHVETSRMKPRALTKVLGKSVAPGGYARVKIVLTPYRKGKRYVDASFQSDQLSGVRGEFEVLVTESLAV